MNRLSKIIYAIVLISLIIFNIPLSAMAADFSDKFELYESWDSSLKEYTMEISNELDIPYSALVAIMYHESRFKSDVGTKYIGLMQVGSTTDVLNFLSNNGLEISKDDLYNPEINIKAGALILRYAMDKTDNIEDAFYVYTCGEGAVKSRIAKGLPKNNATIEITTLYYDYSEYFNDKQVSEYKKFLVDELYRMRSEAARIQEEINEYNKYELEYYNHKLSLINNSIDFIVASLDSISSKESGHG